MRCLLVYASGGASRFKEATLVVVVVVGKTTIRLSSTIRDESPMSACSRGFGVLFVCVVVVSPKSIGHAEAAGLLFASSSLLLLWVLRFALCVLRILRFVLCSAVRTDFEWRLVA